jgi:S1-C subfamily serine protease
MIVVVAFGSAAMWSIQYIDRIPAHRLAALLGLSVSVPETTPTPTPTPSNRLTPADAGQSDALGTVAVQTFSGPVLVRQGAGTAVSVDGLVLTTSFAAPYGSGSYVYQVATSRGQLLRAKRVANDIPNGLVLLKTDANDLDVVLFDQDTQLAAGDELRAVSAQMVASRFVFMSLPAWVVWSDAARQTVLSMDRAYTGTLQGARLITESGSSVGLVRTAAQPGMISAETVNAFLEKYLSQSTKN